jgi:cytoskeletal protein RodZ
LKPSASPKNIALEDPEFETMDTAAPPPIAPLLDALEEMTFAPEVIVESTPPAPPAHTPDNAIQSDDIHVDEIHVDDSQTDPIRIDAVDPDESRETQGLAPSLPPAQPKSFKLLLLAVLGGVVVGVLILAVVFFVFVRDRTPASSPLQTAVSSMAIDRKLPPAPPVAPPPSSKQPAEVSPAAPKEEPPAAAVSSPEPVTPQATPVEPEKEVVAPKAETVAPKPETVAPKPETVAPKETLSEPEKERAVPKKTIVAPTEGGDDMVLITLTGIRRQAIILVNGKASEKTFSVPRSQKALKVEVSMDGYETAVRRVVPGQDKVITFQMKAK